MLKDIKQIDKFKAFCKAGLSPDGEKAILSITLNKELQKALKEVVTSSDIDAKIYKGVNDENGTNEFNEFKRYLVKSVFYSSLSGDDKVSLFNKVLIDDGKITYEFTNIPRRNEFKTNFEETLKTLLRMVLQCEFETTLVFNINPSTTG